MMWDTVMERVIALLRVDTIVGTLFGGRIRAAGTGKQQIPGIEWSLLGDTEGELWSPVLVQFDLWSLDSAALRRGEHHLRALFHQNLPITLGADPAITMWSQYSDGAQLATPDRSNFYGRAVRFEFTPLRQQYALPIVHTPIPVVDSDGVLFGSALFGEELFGRSLFN